MHKSTGCPVPGRRTGRSDVALVDGDLGGMGTDLDPDAPEYREEGESHEEGGDGPGEEDERRPYGNEQRLLKRGLQHRGKDGCEHHGRYGEAQLAHQVADDPEDEGDPNVEEQEPDAVGTDHAAEDDDGPEDREGDEGDPGPETDERQVEDEQDHVPDVHAGDHR